jgi:flagellar L-ring protein precursor FlgH
MRHTLLALGSLTFLIGCMSKPVVPPRVPAVEYSRRIKQGPGGAMIANAALNPHTRAAMHAEDYPVGASVRQVSIDETDGPRARFASEQKTEEGFSEYRSTQSYERDYNGPLALGDPGLTASLWRESNSNTEMFRDSRAFAPMDLITIVVTEKTKATGKADTETKESADVSASIPNLLGLESTIARTNPQLSLSKLIAAATTNDFKGEGTTNREGNLTAKISGVVVEVLPGGLLRIEGEKIISVNSEEQNMVITGLVRTRDISSGNEVDSSKIANLRIDYYGKGIIGEAQDGGWVSRFMRKVWPF